jgi:hypothetical protein
MSSVINITLAILFFMSQIGSLVLWNEGVHLQATKCYLVIGVFRAPSVATNRAMRRVAALRMVAIAAVKAGIHLPPGKCVLWNKSPSASRPRSGKKTKTAAQRIGKAKTTILQEGFDREGNTLVSQ